MNLLIIYTLEKAQALYDLTIPINIKYSTNSGARKCKELFKTYAKVCDEKTIDKLLENEPVLFEGYEKLERDYYKYLIKLVVVNSYKITKNDFTDWCLISSCETLISQNQDINNLSFVTFDKRLFTFSKENNVFYSDSIYKLIKYRQAL